MQRQAMGVALHIVLLPFLELLHSTIDSYEPTISRLFFVCDLLSMLKGKEQNWRP